MNEVLIPVWYAKPGSDEKKIRLLLLELQDKRATGIK